MLAFFHLLKRKLTISLSNFAPPLGAQEKKFCAAKQIKLDFHLPPPLFLTHLPAPLNVGLAGEQTYCSLEAVGGWKAKKRSFSIQQIKMSLLPRSDNIYWNFSFSVRRFNLFGFAASPFFCFFFLLLTANAPVQFKNNHFGLLFHEEFIFGLCSTLWGPWERKSIALLLFVRLHCKHFK